MSERILILGGAGFIGRPLAKKLSSLGHEVFIADNLSVKPRGSDSEDFESADLCDVTSYEDVSLQIKRSRPTVVYYLAAKQGYGPEWGRFGHVNVAAVYTFFEALRPYPFRPRIVLTSSQAIYAPGEDVKESDEHAAPSVYGLSKSQQEEAFFELANQEEFKSTIVISLRPCIVLGPGQSMQSTESGIMRNWIRSWKNVTAPQVYGDGLHMRDFVHVDDIVDAHIKSLELQHSAIINLGGFKVTILAMARLFQKLTGCKDPEVLNRDVRPGGEYTLWSNSSLAEELIGWKPTKMPYEQIKDLLESLGAPVPSSGGCSAGAPLKNGVG